MAMRPSLFEDNFDSPVASAVDWLADVLTGAIATTLCVLAVAFLGFMMISGRIQFRKSLSVVIGCFLLIGASALAEGLRTLGSNVTGTTEGRDLIKPSFETENTEPPQSPSFDPYSGAALRRD